MAKEKGFLSFVDPEKQLVLPDYPVDTFSAVIN